MSAKMAALAAILFSELHRPPLLQLITQQEEAWISLVMMTSSNGTFSRATGPLWGEYTSNWWIPLTKASDAEL